MTIFILWLIIGALVALAGIRALIMKRSFNFIPEIKIDLKNYKKYNLIIGLYWIIIGLIISLLGIPFLRNLNKYFILATSLTIILFIILFIGSLIILHKFEEKEK